jgi:nitric oxide reductase large subunit
VALIVAIVLVAVGAVLRDQASVTIVAGLDVVVFLYSTALGTLGAYFGGRGEA